MKPGLRPGLQSEIEVRVTPQMAPDYDGRIVHPVYSTWAMVHHMELVARTVLLPFLEEHEEAVGTHVNVDHTAPAKVGRLVRIVAEVTDVRGNKVRCRLSAHADSRVLGHGEHVQAVLPKQKLKKLFDRS